VRRKPDGYYTVLVFGALARLRQQGNSTPTPADVFKLPSRLGLVEVSDQKARVACTAACQRPAVRAVNRALSGVDWDAW